MTHENSALYNSLQSFNGLEEPPLRYDILNRFLEDVGTLGLQLYPAQEEPILELLEWKHVIS